MAWDFLLIAMLLYVAITVPLRIGFEWTSAPGSSYWWIDVFVDLLFIFDVLLNFLTAYRDDEATAPPSPLHRLPNRTNSLCTPVAGARPPRRAAAHAVCRALCA